MSAGFVRKTVGQTGSIVGGCSALRDFAIQNAQRIGVDAVPAISAQFVFLLFEVRDESRTIDVAVGGIAEIIDFERQSRQLQVRENPPQERDDFDIGPWVGRAERFHAELMKLAEPARLRSLVAKHRA
jgi:hypothetical protein